MIKAVILDFGGVLAALPQREKLDEWARRLGLTREALVAGLWGEAWRALELGAIDTGAYRRYIRESLALPNEEAVDRFLEEFYSDERLIPGMLDLVRELKQSGRVKVALLTNAFVGQDEIMRRKWGLDPRVEFDVYVNSAEVGLAKPDPAIFRLTLRRLAVNAGDTVFVDDNKANVATAARLGLHAIHFPRPEDNEVVMRQIRELVGE